MEDVAEPNSMEAALGHQQAEIEQLQVRVESMMEAMHAMQMRWVAAMRDLQLATGRNKEPRRYISATKGQSKGTRNERGELV